MFKKPPPGQRLHKFFEYSFFLVSVCLLVISKLNSDLTLTLISTLLLYISGLLYCFEKVRRRIVLLLLYVTIFVFLLSRPTISMFRGNVWWYYGEEGCLFALNAIYLSLLFLHFGAVITDKIMTDKGYFEFEHSKYYYDHAQFKTPFNHALRTISFIGYYITICVSTLQGIMTYIDVLSKSYSDVYTGNTAQLPFLIRALSVFAPYFLCVYLATLPSKSRAFLALSVNLISTIPMLMIGARNNTVLAIMFAFVYFVIRDYIDGTQKWIGKTEKVLLIIAIPLGIAFLGYYNYLRAEETIENTDLVSLIVDFFYKQGVSFDVMVLAHNSMDELPSEVSKCYTFGGMIDYFKHGMISRELFGTISLGDGNNVIKAVYGNSFAHSLAYVAEPNYLSGHGMGSSYILETFADWGYTGIAVFSFFLSSFITVMINVFKSNIFFRIFILNTLTSFFLIPRAEATGWLNFVIYFQFWFIVFFSYFAAHLITKEINQERIDRDCYV